MGSVRYLVLIDWQGAVKSIDMLPPYSDALTYDWACLPAGQRIALVIEPSCSVASLLICARLAAEYRRQGQIRGNTGEPWLI